MSGRARRRADDETIVAVSSAAGAAERGIVRMSGPRAVAVAGEVFRADDGGAVEDLPSWSVVHGSLDLSVFGVPVPALLYLMRAPRSYTREDVVEFHVAGAPPVTATVLAELTARGVRLARPGEFTERAYLSGRIDLSQAEAVLKLIHARSDVERRLALDELTGEFSGRIDALTDRLVETLTRVELALDFSEDDVTVIDAEELSGELADASAGVEELLRSGTGRYVFTERARVALVGRTNTGKSSLFNRLLGRDEAIVTDVHGTTRDVLEAELDLDDVRILLADTAGEKKPAEKANGCATAGLSSRAALDPDDIALERARAELDRADLVLLLIDASEPLTPVDLTLLEKLQQAPTLSRPAEQGSAATCGPRPSIAGHRSPRYTADSCSPPSISALIVLNKTDLPIDADTERTVRRRGLVVPLSCVTGEGLDRLREEIVQMLTVRGVERQGLRFVLNLRQLNALRSAAEALGRARTAARDDLGLEFPAADIRTAINRLRELTHPLDEEEILDRIFSRFCIGK